MSEALKHRNDTGSRQSGCSLPIVVGSLIGFVLGGSYGIRDYNSAVDRAVKEDGFADYLPIGVPIWAFLGAIIGILTAVLIQVSWRLVWRSSNSQRKDEKSVS